VDDILLFVTGCSVDVTDMFSDVNRTASGKEYEVRTACCILMKLLFSHLETGLQIILAMKDTHRLQIASYKQKHTDSTVSIDNYMLYRIDRVGWRGGGVALYVRSTLRSVVWIQPQPSENFELTWVCVNETFIAALYHPPPTADLSD
jgi:hypothetical protein